ncbi:hypothetical protein PHMEG_00020819 [Phytophthora megakarya]|uniref:Uncharacterized protein n=1 Tax=Phytophthora megakarya TaxID=4795 RepID=A0A225VNF0_9STRA|nr:hypothetical protein PHMEG_00020819 [Phytophthora megakarya]
MTRNNELDTDGDVKMSVAPPVYALIKTPKLAKWSQPALAVFRCERPQYGTENWELCVTTGEAHKNVLVTVKSSIEWKVHKYLVHYIFKTTVFALTDEAICREIERKAGSLMNDHVPDVEKMFGENLKIDTSEKDAEAQVANYFIGFDNLVEDNVLAVWVGRAEANASAGK